MLQQLISNSGIESLNAMQQAANNAIKNNNETVLIAPTGSGKTLAFLLPIAQLLSKDIKDVQCLILVPSRELALQIELVWKKMGTGFKVNVCYGGHSMPIEMKNLNTPPALLIGTPGRITDHIHRKNFTLEHIVTLVLDEFDKSLELGFQEEMAYVIKNLENIQKKILVSATLLPQIPNFVGVTEPFVIKFDSKQTDIATSLNMRLIISEDRDKVNTLFQLLCSLNSEAALIFCNHRDACERTSTYLNEKGIFATFYHGGMEQADRERALIQFRNGSVNYLVTTDLAARGLDIPEMKHVIHFQLPIHENEFTHRNGRTARMNAKGNAYLIISKTEKKPAYLTSPVALLLVQTNNDLPNAPQFQTINISGGKKNKLNKVDIVGVFLQKGKLQKEDLGLIEIKDFNSFVAVKKNKVPSLLREIKDHKIKGNKYKVELAR